MFVIKMPIAWGALLSAGVGIAGDVMSQQGQQSTNAMNMAMMQQSEQWQEKMSDTQMQRRVADLKAAGLNPMLAVGGPGAGMGSPVMPNLQNPAASMQSLGSQMSNAVQLQTQSAQIDALKAAALKDTAGARNVDAQTDQVIPVQIKNIQAQTGLTTEEAQKVHANVQMLNYAISAGVPMEEAAQAAIRTHLMQADQQERQDTLVSLIRARNDMNYAQSIGAQNIGNANSTDFGKIMAYFHLAAPLTSAAGVASKFLP